MFRLTMARNDLSFMTDEETLELSNLGGPYYDPKVQQYLDNKKIQHEQTVLGLLNTSLFFKTFSLQR